MLESTDDGVTNNEANRRQRSALGKRRIVLGGIALWLAAWGMLRGLPHDAAWLEMRVQADVAGTAQWFFDRGAGFSEAESVRAPLHAGTNELRFHLSAGVYRALRFDPIDRQAHVRIESLVWRLPPGAPTPPGLSALTPAANITRSAVSPGVIDVWPSNEDPQMVLRGVQSLDLSRPLRSLGDDALLALEIVAALAVAWLALTRRDLPTKIACGMSAVAGLILALAVIAPVNRSVHPDEFSHLGAYQYYREHVLPPAIDDPVTLPSTSVWGYSYLDELTVTYWLAARVMAPLRDFFAGDLYAARGFQIMLWFGLCGLVLGRPRAAIALSVLLLSPQIWYVFSYFNSDAFSLTVALVAVTLLGGTTLREWLEGRRAFPVSVLLFGISLGLLLISKPNYVALVPGFLLWCCVQQLRVHGLEIAGLLLGMAMLGFVVFLGAEDRGMRGLCALIGGGLLLVSAASLLWRNWMDRGCRKIILRLLAVVALALAVAVPRMGWDVYVNGWPTERAERLSRTEEARAAPGFRPSEIAAGKGEATTGLRARGVGLWQVVFDAPYHWLASSVASGFGVYGYMNVFAPRWTYLGLLGFFLGIAALAGGSVLRADPQRGGKLLWVALGTTALIVESSILRSWVDALQPQGRYLFPIFAMLAALLQSGEQRLPRPAFGLLLAAAYAVAVYSFVCVALPTFAGG